MTHDTVKDTEYDHISNHTHRAKSNDNKLVRHVSSRQRKEWKRTCVSMKDSKQIQTERVTLKLQHSAHSKNCRKYDRSVSCIKKWSAIDTWKYSTFSVSPVEFIFFFKNTPKHTTRLNKIQTNDSIDTIKCQQNVLSFNADAPDEKSYSRWTSCRRSS